MTTNLGAADTVILIRLRNLLAEARSQETHILTELRDAAIRLVPDTLTHREFATQTGVSVTTVYRWQPRTLDRKD